MNTGPYLLGLDLGTTRVKALLVSSSGNIVAVEDEGYQLTRPTEGAAEQNPNQWWHASCRVMSAAVEKSGVSAEEIIAVGLAGQMHTAVFLDENLEPLRPAITWADNRASPQAEKIENSLGVNTLLNITYNRSLPGFTAPKVLWLKENEPEVFDKLHKVVLPKDYIRYRLTGHLAGEKAGASATLLFDLEKETWSNQLLDVVGLAPKNLPPLLESTSVAGELTAEAARQVGLSSGTKIIAGAGDQQAGALGIGAVEPGIAVSTIGTGGQFFTTADELIKPGEGRVHVFRQCLPEKWHVMGAMQAAGLALRWFKENVIDSFTGSNIGYEELDRVAAQASPGSDGLLFLPYLTGERSPHMDPNARGSFVGLNLDHEMSHFLRSIMEGVTFGMRDSLEILKELGLPIEEIRCSGGGATSSLWRHIQADIYDRPVVRTTVEESTALGAALLAGIGADILAPAPEELTDFFSDVNEEILPISENSENYEDLYETFKSLYPSLKKQFEDLA